MRLRNVNTTDIVDAIRLGCRCMSRVFNADDSDIPFFSSLLRPEARLSFSPQTSEAHVPGRHLNALLNAERVAGIALDESAVEKHARAAFFSCSGPVPLPLNREAIGGPLVNFVAHNLREGFHALYALAAFRGSRRAFELAERSIAAINEYWDAEGGWDRKRLAGLGLADQDPERSFVTGIARCIGPLVKLHVTTGAAGALELARVLADKACAELFTAEGAYSREVFDSHVHSTTSVMSSLAQLADVQRDERRMARVHAFYDNGLWEIRDAIGWSVENAHDGQYTDFGEANNSGDILETALILARWGHPAAADDAEMILRCHLLPAQLRDNSFIGEPPNPNNEDGLRDLADRHLGAYGFPAPYGHCPFGVESLSFNMDIVGGAVGSLCAALDEGMRDCGDEMHVRLMFDRETRRLRVESPYTHEALAVTVKAPGVALLTVRLPAWVDRERLRVEGLTEPVEIAGDEVRIIQPPRDRRLVFRFDLPRRDLVLHHRQHDIRTLLRGDEVVTMDNFGTDLTYFPSLEEVGA